MLHVSANTDFQTVSLLASTPTLSAWLSTRLPTMPWQLQKVNALSYIVSLAYNFRYTCKYWVIKSHCPTFWIFVSYIVSRCEVNSHPLHSSSVNTRCQTDSPCECLLPLDYQQLTVNTHSQSTVNTGMSVVEYEKLTVKTNCQTDAQLEWLPTTNC